MSMKLDSNESIQDIKDRRDGMLDALTLSIPYANFLGVEFQRLGNEITAVLPFDQKLIGNPLLPALHGGAIAGFLEVSAIIGLAWHGIWDEMEERKINIEKSDLGVVNLPKTIDFAMDFLRPGLARDAYARVTINRSGRRVASVMVTCWQDIKDRPIATANGHFRTPTELLEIDEDIG